MTKITMKQGTTRNVLLTFLQSDGVTPVDLTGGKVYFTVNIVNNPTSDSSAAIQKIITSFSNPTQGQTTATINPSDTVNLAAQTYYHDAKAILANGTEIANDTDNFVLKPAVTKSIS